ncbi:MAG TPA: 5-dehydro-4-deoxy-D-glucuronate isomerase, partial [Anaerolineae bacterium]|nr:5-dehydro-4-deoxy-D-glucuronate isomerase [Anaerolineae bacterium]
IDRVIVGSAVPAEKALSLEAGKELAAGYFAQRREIGVINIGGNGAVTVDGKEYSMIKLDALYIGRGSKDIKFTSIKSDDPALFYIVSYPAHKEYPTLHAPISQAEPMNLGNEKESNKRTVYKYIHPNGIKSCQLVMGCTKLEEGSVWNTMPVHTHDRRSEVYLYFDMDDESVVFHFIGDPGETRHIVVRNGQAVISPSWSIHAGCGTSNYIFIWAMGGENQDFGDMDGIPSTEMK